MHRIRQEGQNNFLAGQMSRVWPRCRVRAPQKERQKSVILTLCRSISGQGGRSPSRIKNAPTHHPAPRMALADKGAIAAPFWRSSRTRRSIPRGRTSCGRTARGRTTGWDSTRSRSPRSSGTPPPASYSRAPTLYAGAEQHNR